MLGTVIAPSTSHAVAGRDEFTQIEGGTSHTVALKADGTVWTWGRDDLGQLGNDAALVDHATPVQVTALTNIRHVSAAGSHSIAVHSNGTVWTWGSDSQGQLGNDAAIASQPLPVQVSGLANVRQAAAGTNHSMAVRGDGTVWAWGDDAYGQLGNNATLADQAIPVQVSGLANVTSVDAGGFHSMAVRSDGTAWTWGDDTYGQLGNNATIANQPVPVQVSGLSNARQVAAGSVHSIALRSDGTVWTFGWDTYGQLGNDAALVDQPVPVQANGLANIDRVAAGNFHSIAKRADGTVWTWGDDANGQLGNDASLTQQAVPVQVPLLTNIRTIAGGGSHGMALGGNGTIWSWGNDNYGQLGNDAALIQQPTPVQADWTDACAFIQVAGGGSHTVALRSDGTVWTWGRDTAGQLGDDAALVDQPTAVQVSGLTNIRHVAAGSAHSIAVRSDGTVWTWGDDWKGQLGNDAALTSQPTPVQVSGLTNISHAAAGWNHSIAVRSDGTVWTWGEDIAGQLGNNVTLADQPTPVQATGLTNIHHVSAGAYHSMAVRTDGTVWTWGDDEYGQLGNNVSYTSQPTPVQATGLANIQRVAAGAYHSVTMRSDGTVWTWGMDTRGQLGNNATLANQPTPVQATGLANISSIAAGSYHSLATRGDGTVWSWGEDLYGQLGNDAALTDQPTPVQTSGLTGVQHLAGGGSHSIALRGDGSTWSWGRDQYGQLGDDAALTNRPTPVAVASICASDTDPPTPNPTTGSSVANSSTQITWTIDAATDAGVGLHANAYGFDGAWQGSPILVQSSLAPNTQHQVSIQARDANDNRTTATVLSRYTPPAAPTALATSNHQPTQVTITWTPAPGQTNQRIEVFTDAACTASQSLTPGVTSPHDVTGLLTDRAYYVKLSSYSTNSGMWGDPTACTPLSGTGRTSVTVGVDDPNATLGPVTPGNPTTDTTTLTTTTYGSTGYTIAASVDGLLTSGANTIPATTSGTIGSPPGNGAGPWVGTGFGITVQSATNLEPGWAAGTNYAALTTTPTTIHGTGPTAFTANTTNTTNTVIGYRLVAPAAQPVGTYTATVTYVVTPTP